MGEVTVETTDKLDKVYIDMQKALKAADRFILSRLRFEHTRHAIDRFLGFLAGVRMGIGACRSIRLKFYCMVSAGCDACNLQARSYRNLVCCVDARHSTGLLAMLRCRP